MASDFTSYVTPGPARIARLVVGALLFSACADAPADVRRVDSTPVALPRAVSVYIDTGPYYHMLLIALAAPTQLTIRVIDQYANWLPSTDGVVLVSRDPSVVTVDSGTWIQARTPGRTRIVASLATANGIVRDSIDVGIVIPAGGSVVSVVAR